MLEPEEKHELKALFVVVAAAGPIGIATVLLLEAVEVLVLLQLVFLASWRSSSSSSCSLLWSSSWHFSWLSSGMTLWVAAPA